MLLLFSEGSHSFAFVNRFKDYVPAKYQSLYQQYLKDKEETIDTSRNTFLVSVNILYQ